MQLPLALLRGRAWAWPSLGQLSVGAAAALPTTVQATGRNTLKRELSKLDEETLPVLGEALSLEFVKKLATPVRSAAQSSEHT